MASLNKVLLLGNLTRQPELRYTSGGMAICEFGLAMNRRFSVNNQEREEVCFVDIVVWGKQAENCGKYLEKGAQAMIEGRLQLDQWQDKETGAKRSRLRVVADTVQFMGRADRAAASGSDAYAPEAAAYSEGPPQYQARPPQSPPPPTQAQQQYCPAAPQRSAPPMPDGNAFSVGDEAEDDIPF